MTGPRVLGIDQSLTSTGLARIDGDQVALMRLATGKLRGHPRLDTILGQVMAAAAGSDLVAVEGLAYGAKGSALLDLAGLHTLITHELWRREIPFAVIAPTVRAVYILGAGHGNAGKDEVLAAVVRRFPAVNVTSNDEADALVMAAMARHWLCGPLVPMPRPAGELLTAVHTDKKRRGQPVIRWPELPGGEHAGQ